MRVLMMSLGLAAVPFAAAVSQNQGQPAATTIAESGVCVTADANRSANSWGHVQITDARRGCSPVPPGSPPPPPPPPPPTSGVGISGTVYNAASFTGLSGWTVQASGPATASAVTDGDGNYTFTGLPAGTYLVCEVLQAGWLQTTPSSGVTCPTGFGYRFTLAEGSRASFVDFGNVVQ